MITFAKRDEIGPIFAKKVRNLVPLKKIYLFGSTSRKKDRIDSDIDIALVGVPNRLTLKENELINDLITDLLLENQLFINWIYFNSVDWEKNAIPIIQTIKKEGVLLWASEKT